MEITHRNGESKMQQETEPFETSGGDPKGAGQSTLLRIHKKDVSPIGSGVRKCGYGSARKTKLKKLDSIHKKGLRIALRAFYINRTQNLLIEAGESKLQQRREIKAANMAVKITKKLEHPINQHLKNKKAYNKYGLRPSPTTPFFVRAKEICSMLEVDLKDAYQMGQPKYTPWITNMEVNIDTKMLALPKGSSTLRIRAELEETLNSNYSDCTQINTDGSKMEE
jgi:hypothetical protein